MNPNSPNDETYWEGSHLPTIVNIQRKIKKGLVKTSTGKTFPVTLQDWLVDSIMLHDHVELKKSAVTGEWIVVNYFINHEVYDPIHNSYQTTLDTMITDERGVPL